MREIYIWFLHPYLYSWNYETTDVEIFLWKAKYKANLVTNNKAKPVLEIIGYNYKWSELRKNNVSKYSHVLGVLIDGKHWNGKVFILMKCSSLAALEVVKMTTSSAASDENFVKMTTFLFQWGQGLSYCILLDRFFRDS